MNPVLPTLSPSAQSWLTDSASLTKRLRAFTDNRIEHHLFYNDWDEAKLNWIRRMEWRFENETWVACVVTIPKTSLIAELADIGHRSIGDILFQDPTLTRTEFTFQKNDEYYSRFSTFCFKEKPIDLSETFYPAFFRAINND